MLKRLSLTGVLLTIFAVGAQAGPILVGSIINDGQTVGPNDPVTFNVRITNTGDEAFALGFTQYSAPFATPDGSYGNDPSYVTFHSAGYPHFDLSPLNPGQSVDFALYTLRPLAAGAALGSYAGKADARMYFGYGWDAPQVSFGIPTWTVGNSASVPDLGSTLLLFGAAVAGIAAVRRRLR